MKEKGRESGFFTIAITSEGQKDLVNPNSYMASIAGSVSTTLLKYLTLGKKEVLYKAIDFKPTHSVNEARGT